MFLIIIWTIAHNPLVYFTVMLTKKGKLITFSWTCPPLCTLGDQEAHNYWHGEAVQHLQDSWLPYLQLPPEMEYKQFSERLNMTVMATDIWKANMYISISLHKGKQSTNIETRISPVNLFKCVRGSFACIYLTLGACMWAMCMEYLCQYLYRLWYVIRFAGKCKCL